MRIGAYYSGLTNGWEFQVHDIFNAEGDLVGYRWRMLHNDKLSAEGYTRNEARLKAMRDWWLE